MVLIVWRYLAPILLLFCASTAAFAFNSNPAGSGGAVAGGNCTGGMFMTGITTAGVPVCGTPSGGAPFPPGNVPQIGGYSALNTGEAETVIGDFAFTRSGANQYTATVTKLNGVAVGALATLNVGTGLTSSGGNLNLTAPVSVANGGTGSITAPTVGQLMVASSATAFTPVTMSNDCTISSAGAITCTKTNGVAFTGLATAAIPLSIANGGRGSSTAPTAGQIDVAQSATAFGAVTLSGDATITSAGVITVTKLNGVAPGPLYSATTPLSIANGGRGSSTAPTVGQFDVASSTTAFSATSMSGDATLSAVTPGLITVTKLNGTTPGGTCSASQFVNVISASGVPTCAALPAPAAGSITDAMLASAYSGVGTCTAGQFVSTLNRNAAPTCTTPAAGNFAPINNPTGGQNNYAPLAGPTFTGSVVAPTLNLTGTAPSLTFSGVAIGGTCVGGAFVSAISNTGVPTCGTNLATVYAPITNPAGGQNNYAPIASPTFTGTVTGSNTLLLPNVTSSSVYWGSTTTPGASISAGSPGINIGSGTHSNGTNWIADATTATIRSQEAGGALGVYINSGLTVGSTFTPTEIGWWGSAGINLVSGKSYTVGGTALQTIYLKQGSGSGTNYTNTYGAGWQPIDATNLALTVTVPSGFKMLATAYLDSGNNTAGQPACFTWGEDGGLFDIWYSSSASIASTGWSQVIVPHVFVGDGVSHVWQMYQLPCGGNGISTVLNGSGNVPVEIFQVMSSN